MRVRGKRLLSVLLIVCMFMAVLPVTMKDAMAAVAYNPDAAIAYAAAHATDTPEIAGADCANFVSKCVTAGGISVSERVCHNLMLALKPYAAMITNLDIVLSGGYGRVPTSGNNASILMKGDVMFVCCERCKATGNNYERHAVIYSGESDSNGYAKCYAHTSMANNTTFWVGYNGTYACSNGHSVSNLAAEVVHFESMDISTSEKPLVSVDRSMVNIGDSVKISWKTTYAASSYWIDIWTNGEHPVSQYIATATSYTFTPDKTGEYQVYITAKVGTTEILSDVCKFNVEAQASQVSVKTKNHSVNVSWTDVGAESYYMYVYSVDYGTTPYANNQGTNLACDLVLSAGKYIAYVTAIYPNNVTASSSITFSLYNYQATTNKGQGGVYITGEEVTVSVDVNEADYTKCYYVIYYTPDNGERTLIMQHTIQANSFTETYSKSGKYESAFGVHSEYGYTESTYVTWYVKEYYTIIFNSNGGNDAPTSQTKILDEELSLSDTKPTRPGYTFLGWSTDSSAIVATYQPGDSFAVNADTTLYAVWEKGCEGDIHSYTDGICIDCGTADPDYVKPVVQPTLTLKAPTLEFKDMICVVAFYTAENIEDVVEMGMITYTEKVDVVDVNTANHMIPGASYEEISGRYYSSSQGIHAKYLGDTVYLAIYAKLSDGTYAYSKLANYSAVQYATNQLKNSSDVKLKQLVVAMLNYGAQAQIYFKNNEENLANGSLTAEQLALPEVYTSDMIHAVPAASTEKQGEFVNNVGFSARKPAISFEGAFCINYFFTPNYAPVDGITLYYWNEADYNAADVLTIENATGTVLMDGEGVGQYRGDIKGISAKDLSKAVYVAAVYSDGTTIWTSGVLGYSIGAYCSSQSSKGGDMADLAMATAVYGYHAKAYFG